MGRDEPLRGLWGREETATPACQPESDCWGSGGAEGSGASAYRSPLPGRLEQPRVVQGGRQGAGKAQVGQEVGVREQEGGVWPDVWGELGAERARVGRTR